MRTARNLQLYAVLFLFLSAFTAAWPWPRWLPELDTLIVRQNSDKSSASQSQPPPTSTASSAKQTNTPSGSGSQTGSATGTNSNAKVTPHSNATSTTSVKHVTSYDPRLPAGGISMMTPAVISGEQYFKIGDFVTFGWNYTSLLATPTAINVVATCTANQQLYTIAMNQTVANSTGAVTWDTGAYQATAVGNPLLTQKYTLIIYDAESSISAQPQAGYLGAFNSYTFGMYTPQPYTPLNEFKCATCSGALSDMERRALGMVVGMGVITVLSFSWFVGGLGVIW